MKLIVMLACCLAGFSAGAQAQDPAPQLNNSLARPSRPTSFATKHNWLHDSAHAAHALAVRPMRSHRELGGCTRGERIISAYYAEGRHTASGQRFDPNGLTAAHRTFPFGTRLLVINPHSGRSVTVTINDRGPFVKGVSLDLSLGAAKTIGMSGTGAVCMAKIGTAG